MNISKELKNILIGFVMGMSQADKEMLFGNSTKVPEKQAIGTQQSTNKNLDFLKAIQAGQLSEEQLRWFYQILDGMDEFHRSGGGIAASGIKGMLAEQKQFKRQDDYVPGFMADKTFTNRLIENSLGKAPIPTLTVLREGMGGIRIEDYCNEVTIKKGAGKLLAEFYCTNYKNDGGNLKENIFERLHGANLNSFTNIKAFNAVRSTATRNNIDHAYKVINFFDIKQLDKGFVVKFVVEEL